MPEEKYPLREDMICISCGAEIDEALGNNIYNQALHDFRLWQEKCLLKVEDILAEVLMKHHDDISAQDDDAIAEAAEKIRNLFGGGE